MSKRALGVLLIITLGLSGCSYLFKGSEIRRSREKRLEATRRALEAEMDEVKNRVQSIEDLVIGRENEREARRIDILGDLEKERRRIDGKME